MRVPILGFLVLSASVAAQGPVPVSVPDTVVYVAPESVAGTAIEVPVEIGGDVTGRGIRSADIEVRFDPAIVSFTTAVLGDRLSSGCLLESTATADQITIGVVCSLAGAPGALVVLQGTLVAGGVTALTFADGTQLNEGSPAAALTNGSLNVVTDPDPSVGDVGDQTVPEDGVVTVDIAVGDQDTPLESLTVTAQSSSPGLITNAGVTVGICEGQDASSPCRTVRVTPEPDAFGTATITLTATDGDARSQDTQTSFEVTVTPVNDAPTVATEVSDQAQPKGGDPVEFDLTALFSDVDNDELQYTAVSSDPATAAVSISGGVASVAPTQTGSATITFTASDSDGLTAEASFTLTVTPGVSTEGERPAAFALRGSAPNPAAASADVLIDLPSASEVHVEVYDTVGRRVLDARVGAVSAGAGRRVPLDLGTLPVGVYVYRVTARVAGAVEAKFGQLTVVR